MRKKICAEVNLQVGKVHPKIFDIVVFGLPIITIILMTLAICELNREYNSEGMIMVVVCGAALIGMLVLATFNGIRLIHFRKCYKDGVVLPAKVKIIDRKNVDLYFVHTRGTIETAKILVEFEYKGETIVRRSGKKELAETYLGTQKSGYQPYYFQYDGDVNILYSEKYDEVFILKD